MDLTGSFGYLVHRKRKMLDLTQEDLARQVGCSLASIRKIESDLRRPSKQIAGLLANALDVRGEEEVEFLRLARAGRSQPSNRPAMIENPANALTHFSLPRLLTSFVGREQEISRLRQLLMLPDCQLITLLGPGGIGKTRLAIQLVRQLIDQQPDLFPDGNFFISLASVSAVDLIPATIAEVLDISLSNQHDVKYQILNFFNRRKLFLILDNMEHLLDGAALVMEILQNAPGVKILVTSRERMKLLSEWVFEVQGLPVPISGQLTDLERNSSVSLFLERARRLQPGFVLLPENAESISRICRLVEGMPLGIELAATCVRALTVDEIAREIESSLDFLTTPSREIPFRQQSLRAVFDHSWELLTHEEQKVMRQLAIFRGGFQRGAAQKVAGAGLNVLSSLMDKSLIRRTEDGRYSIHELVAQYSLGHLTQDPVEENNIRSDHSIYYLNWVKDREINLINERQKPTQDEFTTEIGNIRAAWDWALEHQRFDLIRRAAFAMVRYHEYTNLCREGESLFRKAIEMFQAFQAGQALIRQSEKSILGVLIGHAAFLTFRIGQMEKALDMIEHSLELLRANGVKEDQAEVFWSMGCAYWVAGRYEEAMRLSQEGLILYQELGWKWEAAVQEICIGAVQHSLGNYPEALRILKHSVKLSRETREPRLIVTAIGILCDTLEVFGYYGEMRELLKDAVSISRENRDLYGLGLALDRLAAATLGSDKANESSAAAEAVRLFQEAASIFRDIGDGWSQAHTLNHLGRLYQILGQNENALSAYQQAYRTAVVSQVIGYAMDACVGIAEIKAIQGDVPEALRIAKDVVDNPSTTYDSRIRAEKLLNKASKEPVELITPVNELII